MVYKRVRGWTLGWSLPSGGGGGGGGGALGVAPARAPPPPPHPPIPPYKTLWSSHGESKGVGCHYHVASGFNAVLVRFLSYFSDQRIQWIMILIPSRPFRRAKSGFHFKSRKESWEGPQLPPLLNHSCI